MRGEMWGFCIAGRERERGGGFAEVYIYIETGREGGNDTLFCDVRTYYCA